MKYKDIFQGLQNGQVVKVRYPFKRCKVNSVHSDTGEPYEFDSWRPGCEILRECEDDQYGGDHWTSFTFADGHGEMMLTVVSLHRPGKYPARVFFTREFTSPDGKTFGKKKLRMTTVPAFMALTRGYAYAYEIDEVEFKPLANQLADSSCAAPKALELSEKGSQ